MTAAYKTFASVLAANAERNADGLAFTFISDKGDTVVTNLELYERAQAIARRLRETLPVGARTMILFPPGIDYVASVFGCFAAGVIGVSAVPPHPARLHRTLPRLLAIAEDADVEAVLTTEAIKETAQPMLAGGGDTPLAKAEWIAADDAAVDALRAGSDAYVDEVSEVAFLQYTSGSTATPRGVMLTQTNLLENSASITRHFGMHKDSVGFIWLPPYHDMGLIGGILQPVFLGVHCALMNPLAVIKRPEAWLHGIHKFGATVSGGPNFAYDLCVKRIDEEKLEGLDLSTWEVAFNGAEPVRASTLKAFSERFAPYGFRHEAHLPCYGLAEGTLIITGKPHTEPPRITEFDAAELEAGRAEILEDSERSMPLVSSGVTDDLHDVLIVDATHRTPLADGHIGEVWIHGPSVAAGYWRRDEENADLFGARLAEDDGREWLRSGDLGTIVDGELFIVGRSKDLLIVRGRNIHPHDVEEAAESASALLRPHCSAAFPVSLDDPSHVSMALEIDDPSEDDDLDELIAAIRVQVSRALELKLQGVALVPAGSVPKTTSGKVQRRLCRQQLLDGEIEPIAAWHADV